LVRSEEARHQQILKGYILISFLLIGLCAGLLSGFLGIGGGSIIVPGMVLILGVAQHLAQGVALLVFIPTASLGAYAYYRRGNVDLKVALWLFIGGLAGVIWGAWLAHLIPGLELRKIFGLFAVILGARMGLNK